MEVQMSKTKFVTPKESITRYGNPICVWKVDGGKRTLDDFLTGRIIEATDDVLTYSDSRGYLSTYSISSGDKFEVLPLQATT
jgi:hypothetical protein